MKKEATSSVAVFVFALLCLFVVVGCGDGESDSMLSEPISATAPAQSNASNDPPPGLDPDLPVNGPVTMEEKPIPFTLTSTAFSNGEVIPSEHVCNDRGGANVSPPLAWDYAPEGAMSFALIMDDEVPPCGAGSAACKHWQVYNIPLDVTSLDKGQNVEEITGVTQGVNWNGTSNYTGPCPPNPHTYNITLFALDASMDPVEEGTPLTRSQFKNNFEDSILDSVTLTGTFAP